jgi:hypothetical protein
VIRLPSDRSILLRIDLRFFQEFLFVAQNGVPDDTRNNNLLELWFAVLTG